MRLPNLTHAERAEWERLCEKAGMGNMARQAAAFQQIKSILFSNTTDTDSERLSSIYRYVEGVDDVR